MRSWSSSLKTTSATPFWSRKLLADSGEPIKPIVARSVDEAKTLVSEGVACVLLDLGLPDAEGLDALEGVLAAAPDVAVVVLTGRAESDLALRAVAAGAQDYLTKDMVDAASLTRSIRYAVARKGAIESSRRLFVSELMAAERVRLERGLLPSPLLREPGIAWASRYRPAGGSLLLGGDFFDVVELPDRASEPSSATFAVTGPTRRLLEWPFVSPGAASSWPESTTVPSCLTSSRS